MSKISYFYFLKLKAIALTLLVIFISNKATAQNHHLYNLEKELIIGKKQALYEIGNYLDSDKKLGEALGYHFIDNNESGVAIRLINENSMFLDSEIVIDTSLTKTKFLAFLKKNDSKINFSQLADAFIITPFEERKTHFEVLELAQYKWDNLVTQRDSFLRLKWVKENRIDKLIKEKNPEVLLKISSLLLKGRYRFDRSQRNKKDMVELLQLLTKTKIAVPNEKGELSYHLEEDFYEQSIVNLLIFFVNNYKDYKWNPEFNAFHCEKLKIIKADLESNLFAQLSSENGTDAMKAFITLTKSDASRISVLSKSHSKAGIRTNNAIPMFPFRFLEQLAQLTQYCNTNNIDYEGTNELQSKIEQLKSKLSFKERRKIENELIDNLSLDNITAFEYWCLVYQKSWSLTYSAGRILDRFYSKNWKNLIENPSYLKTYLIKSNLYYKIRIIGVSNEYLNKFRGTSKQGIESLNRIKSNDKSILNQIEKAKALSMNPVFLKEKEDKDYAGEKKRKNIKNFKKSLNRIIRKNKESSEIDKKISYLLSQINYHQIGNALISIENIEFRTYRNKYNFIARDFGFSYIGDIENPEIRKSFLKNYSKYDEKNLYKFYLKEAGIDFINDNDSLDFDKIYDLLKYDITTAFVGGGGSTKDNGVYSIIKILELTFNTTLGYPEKLCRSNNTFGCTSRSRAIEWMKYLEENKLLKLKHSEPVSFNFETK